MHLTLSSLPTRNIPLRAIATTTLVGGLLTLSFAALADSSEEDKSKWGLGLGVTSSQEAYIDKDRDTNVLPLLHFENRYIRLFGTSLEGKLPSWHLSDTSRVNFRLLGRWDGSGYKPDDSWVFDGMDKRKSGLWAGAKIEWKNSLVNVSAEWTHDVSGNSKGQRFDAFLDRSWKLGERFTLTPRLGAIWHDSKYVDYYYGVQTHEARAWRPEYHGESGVSAEFGLQGVYRFNKRHSMMFDARVRSLPSSIKDSPLVDGSTDNRISIGYMYHF
ncbi:MipA/OmpV family protein [Pectobacterium aroidearum]|uniref:MipA/OmpV family protein n=1 Tax=Pectobacterium aroidearum TaxID=1201031 RepID=A0ABR5ZA78_9GAMM|nr:MULTISPECIES: MipA/OmpV family protein [Pectobacterium]MBA5198694.1 MipA/OmpV family protein [Pectobacterium aroidearum]MBA5226802.1 MipA/OmpV family protein [Pectobacterium aroidearum]MBA5231486.1 MipA/OmpV family protein [Pectobacterium aroidearum]MBA5736632.1 MipA/OmpV family protein [Pectobacterium aroidearum]UXJ98700.1 MipA/OmpV family protein [Pectobacterium aroidearum]